MWNSYTAFWDAAQQFCSKEDKGQIWKRKDAARRWYIRQSEVALPRPSFGQLYAYLAYMHSRVGVLERVPLKDGEQRILNLIVSIVSLFSRR